MIVVGVVAKLVIVVGVVAKLVIVVGVVAKLVMYWQQATVFVCCFSVFFSSCLFSFYLERLEQSSYRG